MKTTIAVMATVFMCYFVHELANLIQRDMSQPGKITYEMGDHNG